MQNSDKHTFFQCKPLQYCENNVKLIDEVISHENLFKYYYHCCYENQIYSGEKQIYSYPHDLDELILGHTILELLPCFDAKFSFSIQKNDAKYELFLEAGHVLPKPISSLITPEPMQLIKIMQNMLSAQGKWLGTGCFHRAALFHLTTQHMVIVEDIGRHNCIDRLKGISIIKKLNIHEYLLFTTARITASLYNKIHKAGIKAIISHSAITSSAYLNAQNDKCFLAAYCKPEEERITIFSC